MSSNNSEMGDGPLGSRMVTNDFIPQDEAIANQDGGMVRCTVCDRSFTNRRGLGVHMSRAHPVEVNQRINVERTKARWREEEIERMARAEVRAGGIVEMNKHLLTLFPTRTLEAIKGKRRSEDYREKVNSLRAAGNTESEADAHISNVVEDAGDVGGDTDGSIKEHILGLLDRLDGNNLQSTRTLVEYARRVLNNNPLEPGTLVRWLKTTFKDAKPPRGIVYKGPVANANLSRNGKRREEYAIL